ncbi:MAG: DnaJ domain-containing protein, partial [Bdellovibrionales bacterium]
PDMSEEKLYPILHLLALEKLVHFGSRRTSVEDAARRIKRIKKILAEAVNRDHFQILGVAPKASEREINRNYMELAKNFHPDRIERDAPEELRKLTEQYFARITQAYDILKDTEKRATYAREVNEGSAEKVLQNESLFEQGLSHLRKGKYQLALDIFAKLATQRQHRSDLFIYLTWSKMKVGAPDQKVEKFLTSISEMLNKVPPEDRHSAPYFYSKGLFYLQLGDLERARSNLKHALILDANFVEARRDLAVVRNRLKSRSDTFTEFSTVVNRFFGRRKSR